MGEKKRFEDKFNHWLLSTEAIIHIICMLPRHNKEVDAEPSALTKLPINVGAYTTVTEDY